VSVPPGGITVELTAGLTGQQPSSIFTWGTPSSFTGSGPEFMSSNRPSAWTSNGTLPSATVADLATSTPDELAVGVVGGGAGLALEQALRTTASIAMLTSVIHLARAVLVAFIAYLELSRTARMCTTP
jgi:hypothetical protein